mgnify:CR=1 FL=1
MSIPVASSSTPHPSTHTQVRSPYLADVRPTHPLLQARPPSPPFPSPSLALPRLTLRFRSHPGSHWTSPGLLLLPPLLPSVLVGLLVLIVRKRTVRSCSRRWVSLESGCRQQGRRVSHRPTHARQPVDSPEQRILLRRQKLHEARSIATITCWTKERVRRLIRRRGPGGSWRVQRE